jgi:uncharacterized protein YegL
MIRWLRQTVNKGLAMSDRLGSEIVRRPLHFFWILDVSGSMSGSGKIQALNNAISEAVPHLRDEARLNPHAQMLVRVLAFATEVSWVVQQPTPIEQFRWPGIDAIPQGLTEMGLAMREMASVMRQLAQEGGGFTPAMVLVSDGRPTHVVGPHFAVGLRELLAEAWGREAVRMAIGIGRDVDMNALRRFIGREDIAPARAENPQQLLEALRWASTFVSKVASGPVVGGQLSRAQSWTPGGGHPIWGETVR